RTRGARREAEIHERDDVRIGESLASHEPALAEARLELVEEDRGTAPAALGERGDLLPRHGPGQRAPFERLVAVAQGLLQREVALERQDVVPHQHLSLLERTLAQ